MVPQLVCARWTGVPCQKGWDPGVSRLTLMNPNKFENWDESFLWSWNPWSWLKGSGEGGQNLLWFVVSFELWWGASCSVYVASTEGTCLSFSLTNNIKTCFLISAYCRDFLFQRKKFYVTCTHWEEALKLVEVSVHGKAKQTFSQSNFPVFV